MFNNLNGTENKDKSKKLLKVTEIVAKYGLSRKLIDKAINSGALKAYQINDKERRCKETDVDKWIETLTFVPMKFAFSDKN